MQMQSKATPPTGGGAEICLICDGPAATAVMAAYVINDLPFGFLRKDFNLAEAVAYFQGAQIAQFEQILVAPDAVKLASRQALHLVLTLAAQHTGVLKVLLPVGVEMPLPQIETMSVLYGPPFQPAAVPIPQSDYVPPEPEPAPVKPPESALLKALAPLLPKALRSKSPSSEEASEQQKSAEAQKAVNDAPYWTKWGTDGRKMIAIQPMVGGVGATVLTVNLAAELAKVNPNLNICVVDLNLQFGNVATYFDLARDTRVMDAYRNLRMIDADVFQACLQHPRSGVSVFPAPVDIVPTDGIGEQDVRRLLTLAQEVGDVVLIDLPHLIADWSAAVFSTCDLVLGICALEARCAQNVAKLRDLLEADDDGAQVSKDKFDYVLNKVAVKQTSVQLLAKTEFEKALGRRFVHEISDGGEAVTELANLGQPLVSGAAYNPARKAIVTLAQEIAAHLSQEVRPK